MLEDYFRLRRLSDNDNTLIMQSGLNVIAPGFGLFLEGEEGKGLTYGFLAAGCLAGALSADDTRTGESLRANLLLLYQNLGFLAAWDCYYTMLEATHADGLGDGIDRPSLGNYLGASVSPGSVLSWECLLPCGIALGLGYQAYEEEKSETRPPAEEAAGVALLLSTQSAMIGAGEELFFRGILFPELDARLGSTYLAWVGQALMFGLAHISPDDDGRTNTLHAAAATTFGLYAGWVAWKRHDGLRKAIAAHAWWDLIVLSLDYLADGEAEPLVFSLRF